MGRHELREHLFGLLFRVEFNGPEDMPEQVKLFFEDPERTMSEKDEREITEKYNRILEKKEEIDVKLNEKATGWNTNRMGKVDLTVLRLALYEMLYDEEIPTNVAINEAVEIVKKFGQENSGGFVNAVLDKFVEK